MSEPQLPAAIALPGRVWQLAERILRSRNSTQPPLKLRYLLMSTFIFGCLYGAVMGSFSGFAPDRLQQVAYSAIKVPLLVLGSFTLALPSFYVFNTILGLGRDFPQAIRGLAATQSAMTIILASFAPLTATWYLSTADFRTAIAVNGIMFFIATASAQVLLRRHYGPLIAKNPRHRWMLVAWLVIYAFVAIQLAWTLRPFIGDPDKPPEFIRRDLFQGNAYVVVFRLASKFLTGGY